MLEDNLLALAGNVRRLMKSQIFFTNVYRDLELKVRELLNSHTGYLTTNTAQSTRAIGDAIAEILGLSFCNLLGDLCTDYSADFARRAMADLAFTDLDGFYYVIDVKTHRLDTQFNMPNLTSVDRLARFYEDDRNYFCLMLVSYNVEATNVFVTDVKWVPIEFLSWECLTIGALGWGQIQIANSNKVIIMPQNSRKRWMLELCDVMMEFYPREIAKINERIERFKRVKQYWLSRPDA